MWMWHNEWMSAWIGYNKKLIDFSLNHNNNHRQVGHSYPSALSSGGATHNTAVRARPLAVERHTTPALGRPLAVEWRTTPYDLSPPTGRHVVRINTFVSATAEQHVSPLRFNHNTGIYLIIKPWKASRTSRSTPGLRRTTRNTDKKRSSRDVSGGLWLATTLR